MSSAQMWTRNKVTTFGKRVCFTGRNPTAFTSPLWVMFWCPSSRAFTHTWAWTNCNSMQRGKPGVRGHCSWEKSHSMDSSTKRKVLWSGARPRLCALKTAWVVCTCVREFSPLCLFSKVEVSKLQNSSNVGLQNTCSSMTKCDRLASTTSAERKITLPWFCFAERSRLLPRPHTQKRWGCHRSPRGRTGSWAWRPREPPQTYFGW